MKKTFFKQKNSGLTLVGTMVSVVIVGMVVAVVGAFQSDIFSITKILDTGLQNQAGARKVIRPIASEIRSASVSSVGAFPIAIAGTSTLSFFTNVDGDDLREQITYYLDGTDLKKSIVKPTGNPLTYDDSDAETETLISDVVSATTIFTYYDETYDGTATSTALSQPVEPVDINLIKIEVTIDSDPNKNPPPFIVTTQVAIRNLKVSL